MHVYMCVHACMCVCMCALGKENGGVVLVSCSIFLRTCYSRVHDIVPQEETAIRETELRIREAEAKLSNATPSHRFAVTATVAERDALQKGVWLSCRVCRIHSLLFGCNYDKAICHWMASENEMPCV